MIERRKRKKLEKLIEELNVASPLEPEIWLDDLATDEELEQFLKKTKKKRIVSKYKSSRRGGG